MAYEYEEPLTKKFNEEYRAGRIPNLDLFNELKEVYAKAKAFDEISDVIKKAEFYDRDTVLYVIEIVENLEDK